jgi:hypothetical protein
MLLMLPVSTLVDLANVGQCILDDLPTEILSMILAELLPTVPTIHLYNTVTLPPLCVKPSAKEKFLPLQLVCRSFYNNVHSLLKIRDVRLTPTSHWEFTTKQMEQQILVEQFLDLVKRKPEHLSSCQSLTLSLAGVSYICYRNITVALKTSIQVAKQFRDVKHMTYMPIAAAEFVSYSDVWPTLGWESEFIMLSSIIISMRYLTRLTLGGRNLLVDHAVELVNAGGLSNSLQILELDFRMLCSQVNRNTKSHFRPIHETFAVVGKDQIRIAQLHSLSIHGLDPDMGEIQSLASLLTGQKAWSISTSLRIADPFRIFRKSSLRFLPTATHSRVSVSSMTPTAMMSTSDSTQGNFLS